MNLNQSLLAPVHWMDADSLAQAHHLGVGLGLTFDRLRFLLAPTAHRQRPLSRGQFLFAVVARQPAQSVRAPALEDIQLERVIVLRVHALCGLPDDAQRESTICRNLLQASVPFGHDWDSASLNWGIVECDLLGCYERPGDARKRPTFSGSLTIEHPAIFHHLYQPTRQAMEMLTNGTVEPGWQVELGHLRSGEDLLYSQDMHPARVSMLDIRGKRTAMFGKTRLGKSNVVKLIAQGMLDATRLQPHTGQIIFDVNGEYANTNPQDGDTALAIVYKSRCQTFFLTDVHSNPDARLLRFNFYQRAHEALAVMCELLPEDAVTSPELRNLFTCRLPPLVRTSYENEVEVRRKLRKLMMFWTLLDAAGFECDSDGMKNWMQGLNLPLPFNPGFAQGLRSAAYLEVINKPAPSLPFHFSSMVMEMKVVSRFAKKFRNDPGLNPHGQYIFDTDEDVLIGLLCGNGYGIDLLRPCLQFHDPHARDFTQDILQALEASQTVIIGLSSARENIVRYFASSICTSIFHAQERKFVSNRLDGHYIQIYFEEAHNIFPPNSSTAVSIYARLAKEGAKFNIGIVYSTQSPSTVNKDLLSQTENFFIGHLSCTSETHYLSDVQQAFKGCESQILCSRTPGFIQMLTYSHRYVVPVQAHRYDGQSRLLSTAGE